MSQEAAAETTGQPSAEVQSLWRDKEFVRFWIGQTASQIGTQVSQLTIPLIAVLTLGAPSSEVGLLRAIEQSPYLLFSLFVGVLVDRWRRRNVLVLADFARGLLLAVIPVIFAFHALGISVIYVVGFLVGTFSVFFDVAYQAYLPRMVSRGQLAQGNNLLESSRSAALIGGPTLGGSLVTLVSGPVAVLASVFFFALSALSISRIRRPEPRLTQAERQVGAIRQIREGLSLVMRTPVLRTVAIVAGIFNFSFAAFLALYLLYLPRGLHLPGAVVGLAFAAFGPGFLVGALFASRLPRRFGYGPVLLLTAAVGDAVMFGVPALRGSGIFTTVLLLLINFSYATLAQTFNVALMAVRQAITPDKIQGRVTASIRFIGLGMAPLGSLCGGFAGAELGLRTAVLLAVVGMCLAPIVMIPSPLARIGRELPEIAET